MTSRVPDWLTPVAWTYIAASLVSAAYLGWAVSRLPRGSMHPATALVWITSALYLGPAAVVLFHRYRDPSSTAARAGAGPAALGGLPGGGASALAHLVGVPLVIASGLTIAGIDLWVMILVIGALAILLLLVYELALTRSAQASRAAEGRSRVAVPAVVAAVLTVLAFDVGMGGWMLLLHFNAFMPPATEGTFWFLMQIGILLGLLTAYPAVAWLAGRGSRAVAT
ncbi:DUF4396 domain-containing protein [Nocardioides sp. CFH 31398]|uniref:DUF4396 domain-containing protein n=1 Tax=Nocardioides sp. CFH 31398 TaxID=2919579 RepID=UPI001F06C0C9|nr:DUF4396 domain-containing protein [Nocardioides sp. CFH 31398]MCH1865373.1 DUF4396 domain-containing protein [Nocardioides sp. CFH 31398]MCH1868757.1 DUF4396 domain-containing protein [Nocardioides sp. CFH 31398]